MVKKAAGKTSKADKTSGVKNCSEMPVRFRMQRMSSTLETVSEAPNPNASTSMVKLRQKAARMPNSTAEPII